MGALIPMPNAASPVERILGRFDRAQLEGFIAIAIELLDFADGDPDTERNGDELDGTGGEDDFIEWPKGLVATAAAQAVRLPTPAAIRWTMARKTKAS